MSIFELVEISGAMTGLQRDPKDDMVLECAVVAGATHVVTGDRQHLLPVKEFRGIKIVTPRELLDLVETMSEKAG
jgi:predicted nucleic acid-binding protein